MFSHAILDIRAAQAEWEPQARALAEKLVSASPSEHTKLLTDFAAKVHAGWWDLFWALMGKYNDGYVVTHGKDGAVTSAAVGYPSWWLKAEGRGLRPRPGRAQRLLRELEEPHGCRRQDDG